MHSRLLVRLDTKGFFVEPVTEDIAPLYFEIIKYDAVFVLRICFPRSCTLVYVSVQRTHGLDDIAKER